MNSKQQAHHSSNGHIHSIGGSVSPQPVHRCRSHTIALTSTVASCVRSVIHYHHQHHNNKQNYNNHKNRNRSRSPSPSQHSSSFSGASSNSNGTSPSRISQDAAAVIHQNFTAFNNINCNHNHNNSSCSNNCCSHSNNSADSMSNCSSGPSSCASSPTMEVHRFMATHTISSDGRLNPCKGASRRHSSEVKTGSVLLPKISISRAKSDIDLTSNSETHHHPLQMNACETAVAVAVVGAMGVKVNPKRVHYPPDLIEPCMTQQNRTFGKTLQSNNNLNYERPPQTSLKAHNFQSVTKVLQLKSNKCRVCSESIFFHCYECVQCKLVAHKRCLSQLYVKCPNKLMPPRLAVFGLSIAEDGDQQVSGVLAACILELEQRPINKLKMVYKLEGTRSVVEALCLSFEFGPHLIDLARVSVHDIAGVVKQYLARLSTPIFPADIQEELIIIGKEWPNRKVPYTENGLAILIFELRRLLSYLRAAHRNNLAFLIYHLRRVVDFQSFTEMNGQALAIVFANIIFRNNNSSRFQRSESLPKDDGVQSSKGGASTRAEMTGSCGNLTHHQNGGFNNGANQTHSTTTKANDHCSSMANDSINDSPTSGGRTCSRANSKTIPTITLSTPNMTTIGVMDQDDGGGEGRNTGSFYSIKNGGNFANHYNHQQRRHSNRVISATNPESQHQLIMMDVTFKVRVLELMITYAQDIF